MRPLPAPSSRSRGKGPAWFVDASRGRDDHPGTAAAPWKTVARGLQQVSAGDTLYLRGGVYYENLYIARVGRTGAPITIRSYPGEIAAIDGGFREFHENAPTAWEPVKGPTPDYFRSVRPYPNARYILGWFGDSMVPLLTYQNREDIEETSRIYFEQQSNVPFPQPIYFGPGVWYDGISGHIHVRLSRTHYDFDQPGTANYGGETDPRKLPLVLAPHRSIPLALDGAEHIHLQDLVIRGAGEKTIHLQCSQSITFENVVAYAGTYGMRSRSSGPVRFLHSALYGGLPPWFVHAAGALRNIPGGRTRQDPESGINRMLRDITRFNTHVLIALEGRTEDNVDYAFPGNHHWEFAHCDFTDGFDGIHLSGECIEFHHNRVDRFFDDSIYLTPLTPGYLDQVHVYQNLFTRCFLPWGFGGFSEPGGPIYLYRNVVDMRVGTIASHGKFLNAGPLVTHFRSREAVNLGKLFIYQNTFITKVNPRTSRTLLADILRSYAQATLSFTRKDAPRRVHNNLYVYLEGMIPPAAESLPPLDEDVRIDGNLHWDTTNPQQSAKKMAAFRKSEFFRQSRKKYPPGWEARSRLGDPKFVKFSSDPWASNDYRIRRGSAATGAGIVLPKDLEDPLRPADGKRPDAGALPLGSEPMRVGREAGADTRKILSWLEETQ